VTGYGCNTKEWVSLVLAHSVSPLRSGLRAWGPASLSVVTVVVVVVKPASSGSSRYRASPRHRASSISHRYNLFKFREDERVLAFISHTCTPAASLASCGADALPVLGSQDRSFTAIGGGGSILPRSPDTRGAGTWAFRGSARPCDRSAPAVGGGAREPRRDIIYSDAA
jgi:hypothetical protein